MENSNWVWSLVGFTGFHPQNLLLAREGFVGAPEFRTQSAQFRCLHYNHGSKAESNSKEGTNRSEKSVPLPPRHNVKIKKRTGVSWLLGLVQPEVHERRHRVRVARVAKIPVATDR